MTVQVIALTLLWEFGGCSPAEMHRGASVLYARRWDARGRYGWGWDGVCLKPLAFSCWNHRQQDDENVQRYADQEAELDAALWMRCVQIAMELEAGTFVPDFYANHYWLPTARVSATMAALPEVFRGTHTFRREGGKNEQRRNEGGSMKTPKLADAERCIEIRKASKSGRGLTGIEDREFCRKMFLKYGAWYAATEERVFNETVPFGSSVTYRTPPQPEEKK